MSEGLRDAEGPKPVTAILSELPGYALGDGSIALFGNVFLQIHGIYVAAVSRLSASARAHTRLLQSPGSSSAKINDAISLGTDQFVVVREEVGSKGDQVMMSWIIFK